MSIYPTTAPLTSQRKVTVYGQPQHDPETYDVVFSGQALPDDWTALEEVTGTVALAPNATLLTVSLEEDLAGLQGPEETHASFDAVLDATILKPRDLSSDVGNRVTTLSLKFETDSGYAYAVRSITGDASEFSASIGTGSQTYSSSMRLDDLISLGKEVDSSTSLRVLRHAQYVWIYAGDTLLLRAVNFPDDEEGQLTIQLYNLTGDQATAVLVRRLHIGSHAMIGTELLENKTDVERERIEGTVPKGDLDDLGTHSVTSFGPWGSESEADAFTYTLDPTIKIGQGRRGSLTLLMRR